MSASAPRLRISLLGPFEVWRGDAQVALAEWRTQMNLSVLKVLLDARPQTVPVDRIMDLVWPDADPAGARNSVQVAIRTIRTVLEPELRSGRASRSVRTEAGGYRWSRDDAEIDVDVFTSARDRARAAERRGEIDAAIEGYIAAARVYRGGYLSDDPYAEWGIATRERLHEAYADLVERLSALMLDAGRANDAIGWIERALALDPAREPLYAALMRAHAASGRRAHVHAVYERAERVLRAELGVAPGPELRALRERDATDAVPRRDAPAGRVAAAAFVGRASEVAALRAAWAAARETRGQVVLVSGGAGVGKTRIVRELARSLDRDARVLWVAANEAATPVAFGPFLDALGPWREGASPVLRQRVDEQIAVMTGGAKDADRADALAQAIRMVAPGRALVVFDDLQWADADSVGALAYLTRRAPAGTLVVTTLRAGEPESAARAAFLDTASDQGRLTRVRLEPLERSEVDTVVRAALPDAAPDVTDRVFAATRGVPLFVLELVRALADRGAAALDEVPRTLQDAILTRTKRLGDRERDALAVAAVVGSACRADLVARVLDLPLDGALASLDHLLARELLRPSDDGRAYLVAHPLVERAVYDALSPGRRAAWHQRVADVLSELHADRPDAVASERLRHLVAAGAPWPEIAGAGVAAGDFALARHAYADAAHALERARDALVPLLPDATVRVRLADVRERLADAYAGLARADDAVALYEQLVVDERTAPVDRARLRRKIGTALGELRGRAAEALAALDEAAAEIGDATDDEARAERVRIEAARVTASYHGSRFAEATRHAARAVELAVGAHGVERHVTEALLSGALADQRLGRLVEAERSLRRALTRARSRGDRLAEARVLTLGLASVRLRSGDARGALEAFERGQRLGRELGVPGNDLRDLTAHAMYLVPAGELLRARSLAEESLARAQALGATYEVAFAGAVLGRVLYELGDLAEARAALERAVAVADGLGHRERAAFGLVWLSAVALDEGRPVEARRHARRALEHGDATGDVFARIGGLAELARAELALGESGAAVAHAREALGIARANSYRRAEAGLLLGLAEIELAVGDRRAGREHLEEAMRRLRERGDAWERAKALHVYATTALARRPRERDRMLREALALARTIGAKLLVRRVEEALGAHFSGA